MGFDALITFASRILFVGILVFFALGRWLGRRGLARDPGAAKRESGSIDGFVSALAGLLIAFTLVGAGERFETRRRLVVEEANAIGTAWLRLDLLSDVRRSELRDQFRAYLDARLEAYRKLQDEDAQSPVFARASALQQELWASAIAACREPDMQQAKVLLLPALNEMFDITTTRTAALDFHLPAALFGLLVLLTLAQATMTGHTTADQPRPSWLHLILLAGTVTIAILVIVDYEYPRRGFIRVDATDQVLIDLRAGMGAGSESN